MLLKQKTMLKTWSLMTSGVMWNNMFYYYRGNKANRPNH